MESDDIWHVDVAIKRELFGAIVASQAPAVPEWFYYEHCQPFEVKQPTPTHYKTMDALRVYSLYRDGVSGKSAEWHDLQISDEALAATAESLYSEIEAWKIRKRFFVARDQHRVEMLWRAKWAADLVKAVRKEAM